MRFIHGAKKAALPSVNGGHSKLSRSDGLDRAERAPLKITKPSNSKPQQKKLQCQECGKTLSAPQGLSGHMRFIHGAKNAVPQSTNGHTGTAQPAQELPAMAETGAAATDANANVSAGRTGAREYLVAAVNTLKKRDRAIADDISTLQALHAEKEAIGKELEAVNAALRTFDAAAGEGD